MAPAEEEPRYGGVLRHQLNIYGPPRDPVGNWDPYVSSGGGDQQQLRLVYQLPMMYIPGDEFRVTTDLAERYENPNPTTWSFYLRKGVKFHNKPPVNGRELTSEDIKYSFELMRKKVFWASHL